jgi:hypothetical protein
MQAFLIAREDLLTGSDIYPFHIKFEVKKNNFMEYLYLIIFFMSP